MRRNSSFGYMHNQKEGKKENHFRTDIEGVRAIAILLVVIYHMKIGIFTGGYIGVDVFFVLSGYLITSILIREYETKGKINLLEFYARRIRRLLPAISFLILFTIVFSYLIYAPIEQRYLTTSALSTALYSSNIYFAYQATDYLGAAAENNPFLHTWSLSVEEQYYLFFPIFLIVLFYLIRNSKIEKKKIYIVLAFLSVFIISFILSVVFTNYRQPWAFFLMPFRAWEFAIGSLAFLLPYYFKESINQRNWFGLLTRNSLLIFLGWLGLATLIVTATYFTQTTKFPGYLALLPALGTIALVSFSESNNKWSVNWFLSNRIFQVIGRLSYSWYLWHWVILVLTDSLYGPDLSVLTKCLLMLIAFGIAEISFRFLENPIRHNKTLSFRPAYSIGFAVFMTIVCVSSSVSWRFISTKAANSPEQIKYTNAKSDSSELLTKLGCQLDFYEESPPNCVFGKQDSENKVVLLGDSYAGHWFPAVEEVSQKNGWQLNTFLKSSCPMVNYPFFYQKIGRIYSECETWRGAVLEQVKSIKPDIIFINSSNFYSFTDEEWEKGMRFYLDQLVHVSNSIILFRNTPTSSFDIPICLAREKWQSNIFYNNNSCEFQKDTLRTEKMSEVYKKIQKNYTNVHIIDMTKYICSSEKCYGENKDFLIYRDQGHLTASFVKSLVPKLEEEIDLVVGQRIN